MPPLAERLDLAELVMRSLDRTAELPPKFGVHPRQVGSLAQAMPALLRGEAEDGSADLLGVKWIAGFPDNPRRGLPAYHALVLLTHPTSGEPLAVMDGGVITAARTSAVSGAVIRNLLRCGRACQASDGLRVALLGAGAQARAHLPVIGHLIPGARVRVVDLDRGRAEALAGEGTAIAGVASVKTAAGVREAVDGATFVVSMVSFGPNRQALDPAWLAPGVVFVAVDYDMEAPAALARDGLFLVDEATQFRAAQDGGQFAGYPEPDGTIGQLLAGEELGARKDATASGSAAASRTLVTHLGVGLADVVFGSAILARAEQLGLGRLLPR